MSIKQRFRTSMKKVNGDLLTPVSIFQRLQGERKFLLESSMKYEGHGRYSFIGVNPRKTYCGKQEQLIDKSHLTNKQYTYEGELISLLKQVMPRVSSHTEYPFTGGGIGYIEALASDLPALQFHVYDTLVIFDHLTDEIAVFHTNIEAEEVAPNIETFIDELFANPTPQATTYTLQAIEKQTAGYYDAAFAGDPFALYRKLRIELAAPYMYYIEFDDCTVVGTSENNYLQVRDGALSATTEAVSIERFCQGASHTTNNIQHGELSPTLHAIDVVKALKPEQGLIGYIGFNGQVDFTTPENTITITGNRAQIHTNSTGVPFEALVKG